MARLTRQFLVKLIYISIDVGCMAAAIFLASLIRETTLPFEITPHSIFFDEQNPFRFLFLFWIVVTVIQNNSRGLYHTTREMFEINEIWDVLKSVVTSSLIVIVAIYLLKFEGFPRTVLGLTSIIAVVLLSLWRFIKRIFVEYLVVNGYNNFNVLIIGGGKVGLALNDEIQNRPNLGLKVVGFLDDFKNPEDWTLEQPILGTLDSFHRVAQHEFINKVFITIHHDSKVFLRILEEAKELGIAVRVIPQGYDIIASEFKKYNIGFIPILEYSEDSGHRTLFGKTLFDFVSVLLGLIVVAPLILVIMAKIKLDDPAAPVFYRSRRYGRKGRIFNMLKFRTMQPDADKYQQELMDKNEADGPIFKIKDDPRVTKVGKWLRKYSLDELPQIFNVLKGEMSLVGPRPLPIDQIEKEDLLQLKRLEVKPGITGLWQIRGRSDVSFTKLVKWDIWYITNWSFWLDLTILFQTIPVVIKGKGAY